MPNDPTMPGVSTSVIISLIKSPTDAAWPGMYLKISQNGNFLYRSQLSTVPEHDSLVVDAEYTLSNFDDPVSLVIDFDFSGSITGAITVNEICFDDIFLMLDPEQQGNKVTQSGCFSYEVSLPISATVIRQLSYYRPV